MPTENAHTPSRLLSWIGWAAIIATYLAVRIPMLAIPLERDEGAFARIGQAILRGEVPYRDIFDHKPPGIFYSFAAALLVVPQTRFGIRLFLLTWNFGTLLCLASLARSLAGPRAARWSALAFVVSSAAVTAQGFGATTEMVLLLPLVASVALVARRAECAPRPLGAGILLASGALGAVACWIKQPAALPLAVVPASIVVTASSRQRAGRELTLWLAGGLGVSITVVSYFAYATGLREFWYWTVTHSGLYAQAVVDEGLAHVGLNAWLLAPDIGVLVAIGVAGGVVGLVTGRRHVWIAWSFLILCLGATFPFLYMHYFALLAPGVSVAAGLGMTWVEDALRARSATVSRAVATFAVVAMCGVPLLARPWYWLWLDPSTALRAVLGVQGAEAIEPLAGYLAARTGPDERIFVYGSEPAIAFLANRRDVNPYVMAYPLTRLWPRHREFQQRVWNDLQTTPPAYIILARLNVSTARDPHIDTFFEERLTALGEQGYDLETAVLADRAGHVSFVPAPSADAGRVPFIAAPPGPVDGGQMLTVLFEVWRRR